MNARGLLWGDGAFASLVLYTAFYGWAATLVGWTTCLFVGLALRRWRIAGGCALLGLLPALYILALVLLASVPDRDIAHLPVSDPAILVVLAGLVLATLACPVATAFVAWRELRTRPCSEQSKVRSPPIAEIQGVRCHPKASGSVPCAATPQTPQPASAGR